MKRGLRIIVYDPRLIIFKDFRFPIFLKMHLARSIFINMVLYHNYYKMVYVTYDPEFLYYYTTYIVLIKINTKMKRGLCIIVYDHA